MEIITIEIVIKPSEAPLKKDLEPPMAYAKIDVTLLKDVYFLACARKKPLSVFVQDLSSLWRFRKFVFYRKILNFQSNPNQTRLKN